VNGGTSGTYVLSIPHQSWADFEDKPEVKPFRDMLKEAFGQAEADSTVERFDRSIERESSEIIQFRPDLSFCRANSGSTMIPAEAPTLRSSKGGILR
jgi:hypothetical protein